MWCENGVQTVGLRIAQIEFFFFLNAIVNSLFIGATGLVNLTQAHPFRIKIPLFQVLLAMANLVFSVILFYGVKPPSKALSSLERAKQSRGVGR